MSKLKSKRKVDYMMRSGLCERKPSMLPQMKLQHNAAYKYELRRYIEWHVDEGGVPMHARFVNWYVVKGEHGQEKWFDTPTFDKHMNSLFEIANPEPEPRGKRPWNISTAELCKEMT